MRRTRKAYKVTYVSAYPVIADSKKAAMDIALDELKTYPEDTRATVRIIKAERWDKDRHFITTTVQEAIIYMFIILVLGILGDYTRAFLIFCIGLLSAVHHVILELSRINVNLEEMN